MEDRLVSWFGARLEMTAPQHGEAVTSCANTPYSGPKHNRIKHAVGIESEGPDVLVSALSRLRSKEHPLRIEAVTEAG